MVDIFIWVGRAVCVALIAAAAIALPLTDSATGLKRCDTTERVGRTQMHTPAHTTLYRCIIGAVLFACARLADDLDR